jgi:hypothetical protein
MGFLIYGAACTATLIMNRAQDAGFITAMDTDLFYEIFADCFLAVGLGIVCAAVAQHRYAARLQPHRKSLRRMLGVRRSVE